MRDRLIELCNEKISTMTFNNSDHWFDFHERISDIADYLLANGVIVPPCKVGDILYYLDRYSKSIETDTVKYFTVTKNGCKPILERHNVKFWEMYEWGKTVFLTKEEAEQALKERENNADR